MNSSQFQCPICNTQYTQSNPPRLLTMCGHTFCHKCIKSLISKKKDNKYKIKCHIDKISTQIQTPSPSYFPKNIILLQSLMKAKFQIPSASQIYDENNQFLQVHQLLSNIGSKKEIVAGEKPVKISFKQQNKSDKFCVKHNKNLQVVCCFDLQKICTDCALFGKHKGHNFKNIQEVLKQQKIVTKQLTQLILKKKQIQTKIKNDQIQKQILELLQNKRELLKSQIQIHFQKIYKLVKLSQNQAYDNLNKAISKAQKSIQQKLSIDQTVQGSYKNWASEAEATITNLQSQAKEQNLIKFICQNGYKDLISSGQKIVKLIQRQQDMLIYQVQHQIQGMKFESFNQPQKIIKIDETFQIRFSEKLLQQASLLQDQDNSQYLGQFRQEEESLLDGQEDFPKIQQPLKYSNSLNSIALPTKKTKKSSYIQVDQKSMTRKKNTSIVSISTSNRPRKLTSSHSSSVILKNNSFIKGRSISSKTNVLELGLKYVKGVQKIKNGLSDTLDLSGAQLGDERTIQILTNLKKFNHIKNLKLLNNKLTDSSLLSILTSFPSIQKLNLAQNKFTQKALQNVLEFQKQNKIQLTCLNLAQNKIIQRKQKLTLQQLKNQNVAVSL